MKLLLFDDYQIGVLANGRIVSVSNVLPRAVRELEPQRQVEHVIERFVEYKPEFQHTVDEAKGVPPREVTIRPPLPSPNNVLAASSNYDDRIEGFELKPLDFFYKGGTSISGPGDTVELPDIEEASVFHAEPELACVVGRQARHVSEEEGLDSVFGYLNFIDVSARELHTGRGTFLRKGLEGWAPIGPVIVTADEVPDPQDLRVRLWMNGDLYQDYGTSEMITPVGELIAWLSRYITLMPGDVIASGTHHHGLAPINDGDRVEMEIDNFGRLEINIKANGPRKMKLWRPAGMRPE